jgi:PTH1 family peptidyl-tRNA hydrolase
VLDQLAARSQKPVVWKDKWGASVAEAEFAPLPLRGSAADKVLLCKPMEFMNVSGQAVSRVASFWKVPAARMAVVYDEMDLPFERLRIGFGGGHGGHNGIRSLLTELPDPGFARVRFGIGRPAPGRDAAAWVLANFSQEEEAALPPLVDRAADALLTVTAEGATAAMNKFNAKDVRGAKTAPDFKN